MPPELRAQVEDWAVRQDDSPSLSEAIRRIVEGFLAAESADAGKARKGKGK
jgi:hypothetical protein